jgi:hypothetical protein
MNGEISIQSRGSLAGQPAHTSHFPSSPDVELGNKDTSSIFYVHRVETGLSYIEFERHKTTCTYMPFEFIPSLHLPQLI